MNKRILRYQPGRFQSLPEDAGYTIQRSIHINLYSYRCPHCLTTVIFAYCVQILRIINPINEEHTIQVIYFMMDNDRVETLVNAVKGLPVLVESNDTEIMWASGFAIYTRKTQTAIEISAFTTGIDDLRVDQSNRRTRLPLTI